MQVNDNPQFIMPEHVPRPTEMMSFPDAVKNVLANNYVGFNGRASRSEFWWWTLASFSILISTTLVDGMIFGWGYDDPTWISNLMLAGLFLPNLAVTVRRLHDTGQSGWFLLILLVPLVNCCFYVALYNAVESQPSDRKLNLRPKKARELLGRPVARCSAAAM